ncbi:pantetheine-phosphate adenylyltransferase [Gluconacetobacter diazotrophicus PA1 5]|uniref:Phosphopantetheine adenylyltransferase n=2 Tax=Gluconacetobacter diazotrophicus TaxID=33996 RepID=A9HM68_GLUDA|nr:pantetheine-phosphate adenylyltransferase [Gluconacetobacter diazotrophicus]ACI50335.1 pantetheine-phosphate adenylyltransferase [Gluconacetobacter diazotrophicus PA1 5]MBB2154719.1 pantetheine-phosphate adenylyltransferase [Gluconacetobacter diazotrophicus]TWB08342.1 phosphopantetheine adenylyltransferase [Gluconacetobacter diazotrophicus]CAP56267.1 putative phosphopantetheine adenylyltransferase [Gluconacetobacter diazotrophicus PA1 5]
MPDATPRTGFYPGTFDPMTNGHLDIVERAARLVDRLVVGVAENTGKQPLMPLDERVACVQAETRAVAQRNGTTIDVVGFGNLLVEVARSHGATVIVRGLRAVVDFDYEVQMFGMNHHLAPDIETVFLMATERNQYISSRLVKEVARLGGDITGFVPPFTRRHVLARLEG